MSPRQRQIAYIGAGVLVLAVLYRWMQSRGGSSAANTAPSPDGTASADYAQLAGQQQADSAALSNAEQSDFSGLQAGEQADFTDVTNQLGALAALESADVGALSGQYSQVADQLGSVQGQVSELDPSGHAISSLTDTVNKIAAGQLRTNRKVTGLAKQVQAGRKAAAHVKRTATTRKHAAGGHTGHQGHQSTHKHAGSGAVAPSSHERKPAVKAQPRTTKHATSPVKAHPKAPIRPRTQPKPHPQQHPHARKR